MLTIHNPWQASSAERRTTDEQAHQGERKSQNHTSLWHVRSLRGSAGGRRQRMCQSKKRSGYARVNGANAVSSFLTPTPPAKFTSTISVVASDRTPTTIPIPNVGWRTLSPAL